MVGVVSRDLERRAARKQANPELTSTAGPGDEGHRLAVGGDRRRLLHADKIRHALEDDIAR